MQQCKQLVSEKSAEDYTMLAQDEAGVRLGACGGYGWRFKAGGCEVGVGFSTKETRIIGAVGPDAVHVKVVESVNADTFIEFLKEMRQIYKKFVMFLDSLSAHKAAKVSKYIESTDVDVILVYLPSTPRSLTPWRSSGGCSRTCLPSDASIMPRNLPSQSEFWSIPDSSCRSSRWIT